MDTKARQKMELLAPAGSIEAFEAAVVSGADAIYLGAPTFNARALARHFSRAELAAMVDHAHRQGILVYIAMNSLMKDEEIPQAVETLALLDALGVDALIIQDLGIYALAKRFFPGLRLHASTLMGAHNSLNVRQLSEMGFERVVLARELTLAEIGEIHRQSEVELEVFVHGALCFAYSGLCLFSSYFGGKSGLRGRCVQPCRRRYTWGGGKEQASGSDAGYLFSMSDLSGLSLLPALAEAGVSSLKIEGRMRSAQYVASVVKAYRLALDHPDEPLVLAEAAELLDHAMGRRTSSGYFKKDQPEGIIVPEHSGNIGLFLGKVTGTDEERASLLLKEAVRIGDRLRLHQEGSGERQSFSLKRLWQGKNLAERGQKGDRVQLALPPGSQAQMGDSLYKVEAGDKTGLGRSQLDPSRYAQKIVKLLDPCLVGRVIQSLNRHRPKPSLPKLREERRGRSFVEQNRGGRRSSGQSIELPLNWWLKIDDLDLLRFSLPAVPSRLVIRLSKETYRQLARQGKRLIPFRRRLIWALPPVILEEDLAFYREAIRELREKGYHTWQIGHLGQRLLFSDPKEQARPEPAILPAPRKDHDRKRPRPPSNLEKPVLYADYPFNLLNSQGLAVLGSMGFAGALLAIETDRHNLTQIMSQKKAIAVGLTVYGRPALFTARLKSEFFRYDQPLVSPKGETIYLIERFGHSLAVADRPFSLLPQLKELADLKLDYLVIDLCNMRPRNEELSGIFRGLRAVDRQRRQASFNYLGNLL